MNTYLSIGKGRLIGIRRVILYKIIKGITRFSDHGTSFLDVFGLITLGVLQVYGLYVNSINDDLGGITGTRCTTILNLRKLTINAIRDTRTGILRFGTFKGSSHLLNATRRLDRIGHLALINRVPSTIKLGIPSALGSYYGINYNMSI